MTKFDAIKSKVNDAEDFARKIWLAGLGAYGKSIDEVQGRYEKLNTDASKVFDELVEKGSKIEAETKDKIKEKTNVEARVAEVRKKLGLDKPEMEQKVDELSAKIDALTLAVAKLAEKKVKA
ncbi:phasin-related domain-containing protein [Bowmanella dokdonensis]|uniref:Phasin family protein n=1 Tax=Bowmanella dokdonensis TaxID=751969 RepID=A0A939DQ57_9ALTE|nr:phasin family protein [Bowmanella dokdonensis]MBN7826745.1 phasin family protein [Bowmanella dokdonensis]